MANSEVRNNINMESVEKALDSLKDLFKEIIQENKTLKEDVENLKNVEEQRKRAQIEELKSNIANLEYQKRASNMLREILNQNSPKHWMEKLSEQQSHKTPLDILIERERKGLYGYK